MPELIYLASPYSHPDPEVMRTRFMQACEAAAILMLAGNLIFSPIAHTHPIAQFDLPKGWEFWEKYDRAFLDVCSSMIVLRLPGWKESKGIAAEIAIMEAADKPISYMDKDR